MRRITFVTSPNQPFRASFQCVRHMEIRQREAFSRVSGCFKPGWPSAVEITAMFTSGPWNASGMLHAGARAVFITVLSSPRRIQSQFNNLSINWPALVMQPVVQSRSVGDAKAVASIVPAFLASSVEDAFVRSIYRSLDFCVAAALSKDAESWRRTSPLDTGLRLVYAGVTWWLHSNSLSEADAKRRPHGETP